MKKKMKQLFTILLSVMMLATAVCGSVETVSAATMSKTQQHKLYDKTMKSYVSRVKNSLKKYDGEEYAGGRKFMYVFADIDKNGIDELIMRYDNPKSAGNTAKSSGYGESTSIYTINKSGKVATVLNNTVFHPLIHTDFVRIFTGRNRIDMGFSHGYDDHLFCKYSNGKLNTKSERIRMTNSTYSGKMHPEYNSKPVSYSWYKAKYKELTNSEKGYKMKLCKYQ